jgi:hypothetical protein
MSKATLDLKFGMAQHDPTNTRTLDASGNGNHATLGNGSTSTTFPTKLTEHGYSFDGGDHLDCVGTGVLNSAEIGIVIEFYPDFETGEDAQRFLFDTSADRYLVVKQANALSNVLNINLGGTPIATIAEATYSPYWNVNGKNVLVISGTTGNTSAWLNGNRILSNEATAWSLSNPTTLIFGARGTLGSGYFTGKMTNIQVYHFILTPTQVQDIQINSNKKINEL